MASSTKGTKAKVPDVRKMLAPLTQDFATRDRMNRAIMILNNHQLLMKYALTNDQVSECSDSEARMSNRMVTVDTGDPIVLREGVSRDGP